MSLSKMDAFHSIVRFFSRSCERDGMWISPKPLNGSALASICEWVMEALAAIPESPVELWVSLAAPKTHADGCITVPWDRVQVVNASRAGVNVVIWLDTGSFEHPKYAFCIAGGSGSFPLYGCRLYEGHASSAVPSTRSCPPSVPASTTTSITPVSPPPRTQTLAPSPSVLPTPVAAVQPVEVMAAVRPTEFPSSEIILQRLIQAELEERSKYREERQLARTRELRGYWLSTDPDLCGRDELLKVAPFVNGLIPVALFPLAWSRPGESSDDTKTLIAHFVFAVRGVGESLRLFDESTSARRDRLHDLAALSPALAHGVALAGFFPDRWNAPEGILDLLMAEFQRIKDVHLRRALVASVTSAHHYSPIDFQRLAIGERILHENVMMSVWPWEPYTKFSANNMTSYPSRKPQTKSKKYFESNISLLSVKKALIFKICLAKICFLVCIDHVINLRCSLKQGLFSPMVAFFVHRHMLTIFMLTISPKSSEIANKNDTRNFIFTVFYYGVCSYTNVFAFSSGENFFTFTYYFFAHMILSSEVTAAIAAVVEAERAQAEASLSGVPPHVLELHSQDTITFRRMMRAPTTSRYTVDGDVDDNGNTLLHWMCHFKDVDKVLVTLKRKADPNRTNHDGDTPLHVAARCGAKRCCHLLVRYKANAALENNAGKTSADIAREGSYFGLASELDEARRRTTHEHSHTTASAAVSLVPSAAASVISYISSAMGDDSGRTSPVSFTPRPPLPLTSMLGTMPSPAYNDGGANTSIRDPAGDMLVRALTTTTQEVLGSILNGFEAMCADLLASLLDSHRTIAQLRSQLRLAEDKVRILTRQVNVAAVRREQGKNVVAPAPPPQTHLHVLPVATALLDEDYARREVLFSERAGRLELSRLMSAREERPLSTTATTATVLTTAASDICDVSFTPDGLRALEEEVNELICLRKKMSSRETTNVKKREQQLSIHT